jgi:hypothetical protein
MKSYLRQHHLAFIALFVALSATAYAGGANIGANDIKDNAVRSKHIKNEHVRTADVADDDTANALTGTDVTNGGLTGTDIADGTVGTGDLANGAVTSAKVGNNAVGSGDLATITEVAGNTFDFGDQDEGNNDHLYGSSTATCPGGSTVIGGGAEFVGTGTGGGGGDELQAIHESRRSGNGWFAIGVTDVDNQDFRAFAYCLTAGA